MPAPAPARPGAAASARALAARSLLLRSTRTIFSLASEPRRDEAEGEVGPLPVDEPNEVDPSEMPGISACAAPVSLREHS